MIWFHGAVSEWEIADHSIYLIDESSFIQLNDRIQDIDLKNSP